MGRLIAYLIATALLFAFAEGFSSPVVIIGKVIIDEYGDPSKSEAPALSIGGGGPQAAFGAACGMAVRDCFDADGNRKLEFDDLHFPPCMPVAFLGAVGNDWSDDDTEALRSLIGPALAVCPVLVQSDDHITPRIRLWHDESQNIQWYAVNASFGPSGADGLWRNRPSANDILAVLDERSDDTDDENAAAASLHMIVEAGEGAAGGGLDSEPLRNSQLLERISFVGVEPIAFINDAEGKVSATDAASCVRLMESLPRLDVLCPDNDLQSSLQDIGHDRGTYHIVTRNGPRGSILYESGRGDDDKSHMMGKRVPAATLATSDGQPVNPTGAGNAYSGALSALLGTGSDLLEAATIATGVGAAVCEFKNLPPYSWETLERIRDASDEVREKLKATKKD